MLCVFPFFVWASKSTASSSEAIDVTLEACKFSTRPSLRAMSSPQRSAGQNFSIWRLYCPYCINDGQDGHTRSTYFVFEHVTGVGRHLMRVHYEQNFATLMGHGVSDLNVAAQGLLFFICNVNVLKVSVRNFITHFRNFKFPFQNVLFTSQFRGFQMLAIQCGLSVRLNIKPRCDEKEAHELTMVVAIPDVKNRANRKTLVDVAAGQPPPTWKRLLARTSRIKERSTDVFLPTLFQFK